MTTEVSYLTTREVADLFRVDPATVRRWAVRGAVQSITLPGGEYRFPRQVIEAMHPTPSGAPLASTA